MIPRYNKTSLWLGGAVLAIETARIAVMGLALTVPAICLAASYTVLDLGTLGGDSSAGSAINYLGQVVGSAGLSHSNSYQHGFLYQSGSMSDLGPLGPHNSDAFGINNSGQIVGSALVGGRTKPVLWQNGILYDLAPNAFTGNAYAINDVGQVVGDTSGDQQRAFIWSQATGLNYIGTLGGSASGAEGINASGQVVGSSFPVGDAGSHAFLYSNGVMKDLGTLPGDAISAATAINDTGQIVGLSVFGGINHAFLYSEGTMRDLGTLGANYSRALAINNDGKIVGFSLTADGWSRTADGNYHAFLYFGDAMTDLNTLIDPSSGWVLQSARAINELGQITGYGAVGAHKENEAFLLTPLRVMGDFNQDGQLTNSDVQAMLDALMDLNNYKVTHKLADSDLLAFGDLNRDHELNSADVPSLLGLLTGTNSVANIPEPSSVVLLALGSAVVLLRWKSNKGEPILLA